MGCFVTRQLIFLVFIFLLSTTLGLSNRALASDAIPLPQQLLNDKLLQAIDRKQADLKAIDRLLKKGASAANDELLEKALTRKHADVLKHLLETAYVAIKQEHYNVLLSTAVKHDDWDSVNVLLKHSTLPINMSMLLSVAEVDHLATFEKLQQRTINDDLSDYASERCLLKAAVRGNNNSIVTWLIAKGIRPDANTNCADLLVLAVKNNHLALVKTLVEAGATIDGRDDEESPILLAIQKGELPLVQYLLKKGARLQRTTRDNPLGKAAFYGHNGLLAYLLGLEKKEDDLQKSSKQLNALMIEAVRGGQLKTLQFLQQHGADVTHKIVRPALLSFIAQMENPVAAVATTTALHLAAENGHVDVVRYLLETGKVDVNAKEISGSKPTNIATLTALHFAVERGDHAMVDLLVQYDADLEVVDSKKGPPLLIAVQHNHLGLVRLLVNKKVAYPKQAMYQLPLQAAVLNQNLPMVEFLLNNSASWWRIVNNKNQAGETALHIASRIGNMPLVRLLINNRTQVDTSDANGNTALHNAVLHQHHDVFQFLLQQQYQINVLNHQGQTPLAMAIALYDGFYAAKLLANQANIHLKDQHQQTLLHQLTTYGDASRYDPTTSALKSVNLTEMSNQVLLHLMADENITARIEWLLRHKIDINAQDDRGNTALHQLAMQKNDTRLLQRLLQQKPLLNALNQQGNSPLYLAIRTQTEIGNKSALLLLQAGADPNQVGEHDKTPLYLAVEQDNLALVEQLLRHGAKVNQRNQHGQNPLFALVDAGTSTVMVEKLIAAGINLKNKDQQGNSIIQALSNSMSKDEALPRLQLMLNKGADPNVSNTDLETPLHHAVLSHAPKTAQRLLTAGANPNAQDKDGATPLHYAVRLRGFTQIEQLIAHQAKLNLYNRFGKTALHIAVEEGDKTLVKRLLTAGASIHSVDKDLRTPLITAVAQNDTEMALLLLQQDANVNALSKGGWRPLHLAVQNGNTIIVKALLAKGADRQHRLWRGDTVSDLLKQHGIYQQHTLAHWLATTKLTKLTKMEEKSEKKKNIATFLHAANHNKRTQLEKLLQQGTDINSANRYGQTALHNAIETHNVALVAWLLEHGADANKADLYQQSPLEKALLPDAELAPKAEKIVRALLAKGADINAINRHSETLLLMAVRNKTSLQKIQLLLAQGATVNVQDYFYNTPLLEASRQGKVAVVKTFIAAKAPLNQANQQGDNGLHLALNTPINEGIAHLLTPPQNLQQLTQEQQQKFTLQAEENYRQVAIQLLKSGIDNKTTNIAGQSPLALAVKNHRLLLIKKLLQQAVQKNDHTQLFALTHRALQQQQFGIARLLLSHDEGISLNNDTGWKLLKTACANTRKADHAAAQIVRLLLEKGALQQLNSEERKQLLMESAAKNDAVVTLTALQQADINVGQHLLPLAAQYNAPKIVRLLLKEGMKVDQMDNKGRTALMLAVEAGAEDVVNLLLTQKADPNHKDKQQITALERAVSLKKKDQHDQDTPLRALRITQQLIKHGAKHALVPQALHLAIRSKNDALMLYLIDELDYQVNDFVAGNMALHTALKHFVTNDYDDNNKKDKGKLYNLAEANRISLLISKGAAIDRANKDNIYPIQQALPHPIALALLIQHGAEVNRTTARGHSLIHTLVRDNDNPLFNQSLALLLKANSVATHVSQYGDTPLHTLFQQITYSQAEQKIQLAKLGLLLQQKSVISEDKFNTKNNDGNTVLTVALNNHAVDKIQPLIISLLAHEPILSTENVLQACHYPMILNTLLKQGAEANSRHAKTGKSCLHHIAERFGREDSVAALKLLLQHGADINQQDKQGYTALHHIVAFDAGDSKEKQQAKQQALDLIWQQKIDVTLRTKDTQQTALFFATDAALVQTLLKKGFARDAEDHEGNTLLQTTQNTAITKLLLAQGSAIEHKNQQGETALFISIKNNQQQRIEALLAKGANPNLIDAKGNSVLHTIRSVELAEQLLAKGAKVNHRNKEGDSPLHTAGSLALVEKFIAYKAALNQQNNAGQTALIRAAIETDHQESAEIAHYLLDQGADVTLKDQWGETAFFKTAYTNDVVLAKRLLEKGSDSHFANTLGDYPLHVALSKNNQQMAELLIVAQAKKANTKASVKTILNSQNWQQKTPLAFAFEAQHFGLANLLRSQGASKPKWPAKVAGQAGNPFWLQRALQNNLSRVAAELLVPMASVDSEAIRRRVTLREYGTNETNLHLAAVSGATALITPLLDYGAMINTVNSKNETALHRAVSAGHIHTVKALLAQKAALALTDNRQNTVLHRAADTDDAAMLSFLLALKAADLDINATNLQQETALHIACRKQNSSAVKALLSHQANINVVDNQQMTPLLIAAQAADETIISQLLSHGADVHARDGEGRTALLVLLHQHIYFNEYTVKQRDHAKITRLVDLLLKHKANLQAAGKDGRGALHLAMPIKETAHHLLDLVQKKDLHQADKEGDTALFHAVRALYDGKNPTEIPLRLLKMDGTLIKHKNKWGETALQKAIGAENIAAIRLLIEYGVDVNAENKGGYTPLLNIVRNEVAALKQQPLLDLLRLFVTKGADINKTDERNNTPLHIALSTKQDAVAHFLIASGVQLNQQNNHGDTALHLLAQRRHSEDQEKQANMIALVDALLAKKAKLDVRNANSSTPLHLAVKYNKQAIITRLLTKGADANAANTSGETTLHLAVKHESEYAVKQLLAHHAAIAAKDNEGNQALHHAVRGGNKTIIKQLLTAGADVNSANYARQTPKGIAFEQGEESLESLGTD